MELKDLLDGDCYHICTNGQDTPILMRDDEDYRVACVYLALLSLKLKIDVLAYVVMSNHVHIMVDCQNRKEAKKLIRTYKQKLSLYLKYKYGVDRVLLGVADSITEIDTLRYFQNCVAYILRNALCAKVCSKLEDYPWSSYSAYFNDVNFDAYCKVTKWGARERKKMLKSKDIGADCPYYFSYDGAILNRSFIRYDVVEAAFKNSSRSFLYFLGTCNDAKMEYDLALKPQVRVGDAEMINAVEQLVSSRFPGCSLASLTHTNKCSMVKTLFFNNKTSVPQLSRVLGLSRQIISNILAY